MTEDQRSQYYYRLRDGGWSHESAWHRAYDERDEAQ